MNRIAHTPELRRQALELVDAVNMAAWAKPTDQEIYLAIQPMTLVFKIPEFPDPDPRISADLHLRWIGIYYEALRDLPIEAIKAGVNVYLKAATYGGFPVPGELRAKIEPFAIEIRTAAHRLKAALAEPGGKALDPGERAKVREWMAQEGWLDADGKVDPKRIMTQRPPPAETRTKSETPAEMAARIRASANL